MYTCGGARERFFDSESRLDSPEARALTGGRAEVSSFESGYKDVGLGCGKGRFHDPDHTPHTRAQHCPTDRIIAIYRYLPSGMLVFRGVPE